MNKSKLRKIYLAKRKELSPEKKREKSFLIGELFFLNFDLKQVKFLHSFLPIERLGEIDTRLIIKRVWRDFPHTKTIVPRVNFATGEMESLVFAPETVLTANRWQIDEPSHNEIIEAEKIDLVLVPLLCFDQRGFRAGYGKGFYDKFLKDCRHDCLKIGLSFFEPVERIEDVHDSDVPLDFCVTPDAVFKF